MNLHLARGPLELKLNQLSSRLSTFDDLRHATSKSVHNLLPRGTGRYDGAEAHSIRLDLRGRASRAGDGEISLLRRTSDPPPHSAVRILDSSDGSWEHRMLLGYIELGLLPVANPRKEP